MFHAATRPGGVAGAGLCKPGAHDVGDRGSEAGQGTFFGGVFMGYLRHGWKSVEHRTRKGERRGIHHTDRGRRGPVEVVGFGHVPPDLLLIVPHRRQTCGAVVDEGFECSVVRIVCVARKIAVKQRLHRRVRIHRERDGADLAERRHRRRAGRRRIA